MARWSGARIGHAVYAHTSPVYLRCGRPPKERREAVQFFLHSIDESLQWIDHWGRYNNDQQRDEVKELFRRGRPRATRTTYIP
ncbi:MAG: hypothetical protein ACI906_004629 [Candidatus Latescibacterota bacterium]|jgi:hypothetical protein